MAGPRTCWILDSDRAASVVVSSAVEPPLPLSLAQISAASFGIAARSTRVFRSRRGLALSYRGIRWCRWMGATAGLVAFGVRSANGADFDGRCCFGGAPSVGEPRSLAARLARDRRRRRKGSLSDRYSFGSGTAD